MSEHDPDHPTDLGTATLEQARQHARAQAGTAARAGPTLPASAATHLPPGVDPASVLWDELVMVGGYAARRLPRHSILRVEARGSDACAQVLVYNAHNTAERLNVADTVKVQWQAYLGQGSLLLSDMGRSLMTIVEDTSAGHDCLCGASNRRANDLRYGDGSVSGTAPNARDLLALGALKHGLSRVDIGTSINLFTRVRVADDGSLHLEAPVAPGSPPHVALRADLDVIVLVANTPHVLDEDPKYGGSALRLTAWPAAPAAPTPTTPERARAYLNNDDHLLELA